MRPVPQETRSTRFFDRLTRRAAVIGGAGLTAAALGGTRVSAQAATPVAEATPVAAERISLLFVQHGGQTTLTPGTSDVHTLTMTGVLPQTVYFSDRPNRIAGAEPTALFAEKFAEAFASSPPNASLIGHLTAGAREEEVVIVTLLSAAYDADAATLTYEVQLIDAEAIGIAAFEREPLTVFDAPREYAEAHLFIDDEDLAMCLAECAAMGLLAPIFLVGCAFCPY